MKKIFMLLAIAGMFGVTSCGGDVCSCLKDASDEESATACFDEGTSVEDMASKAIECAEAEVEGEGEGEEESH